MDLSVHCSPLHKHEANVCKLYVFHLYATIVSSALRRKQFNSTHRSGFVCDATQNDISVEVLSEDIDPVMIWKGVAMTFCLLCIVSTLLRGSVGDRKTALLFVFSRAVDICKSLDVFAICLIFL